MRILAVVVVSACTVFGFMVWRVSTFESKAVASMSETEKAHAQQVLATLANNPPRGTMIEFKNGQMAVISSRNLGTEPMAPGRSFQITLVHEIGCDRDPQLYSDLYSVKGIARVILPDSPDYLTKLEAWIKK